MKNIICKNKENLIALILIGIASFIFLFNSPLHPWIGGTIGTDSGVFKTIALVMEKGGMPYVDSFDHKGPLLYIINWLGNRIAHYRGVWVIEFFSLALSAFMIYKSARITCGVKSAYISLLMAISLLFGYFDGGNLTEEYAMPLISIALYLFMDYYINRKISPIKLILCGCCFGGALMLRPNMISIWAVMCIGVFLEIIIINKEWKKIGFFIRWFLVGMAIIILPIIIWLAVNGALKQCWHDYILFNMVYTSKEGGGVLFSHKWNSYFTFAGTTVYLIALISLIILRKTENIFFNYIYLIYLLITPLFMCLSGATYGHYGMILVPAVSYPISLVLSRIEKIETKSISHLIFCIVGVYCLSTIILPNWVDLIKTIPAKYEARNDYNGDPTIKVIADVVDSLTEEDDKISVVGNWDAVYVICNRLHATRYSYQKPIAFVMPNMWEEYFEQLQEEQPHIIVIQSGCFYNSIYNFLLDNGYELVWSQNGESLDGALIYYK